MSELLKIKHIKIALPVRLKAHKLTLWNNLETITIDHSQKEHIYDHGAPSRTSTMLVVAFLLEASKKVRKLTLTVTPSQEHQLRFSKIKENVAGINEGLELNAKHETCGSDHIKTWTWENEGGRPLRWGKRRGFY